MYLVSADGRGARRLTEGRSKLGVDGHPAWSPDGAEIAFDRPGGVISVIPAAGGRERRLARGFDPPGRHGARSSPWPRMPGSHSCARAAVARVFS